MAEPQKLTLDDLESMEGLVVKAAFDHSVASMKRATALRRLSKIRAVPLDDRTVEEHRELSALRASVREYERAMAQAERTAQDIEAAVIMDDEARVTHPPGAPMEYGRWR